MTSHAVSAYGAAFYRWTSSAWVEVAEIIGIEGPNRTRKTIEVTTLDSADQYEEFIADMKNGGNVVLTMNFYRTNYDIFDEDMESNDLQNYAIVINDDSRSALEIEGLVVELPIVAVLGNVVTSNVTIKVTGKPTLSDGSSGAFGA